VSAKLYVERKTEIVTTAMSLFFTRGYENTTIAEIIDTIGIAKGTFYHYFSGKEELLEEIVEVRSEEAIRELSVIVDDETLSATEKIARYFREAISWKSRNRELSLTAMRVLYRDENLRLRRRMLEGGVVRVAPIVAGMVREGVESGEFAVADPDFVGDFLIRSITAQNERLGKYILANEDSPDLLPYLNRYFDSLERVVERILGLAERTLRLADREAIAALFGPQTDTQNQGDER
jgi:AcrR family transcriptional regulator